jgi:hypothetical protein
MEQHGGLIKLSTEYWRLLRLLEKAVKSQPFDKRPKGTAQLQYAQGRLKAILEENGLRLISYDKSPYSPNLPVTVANEDDVYGNEKLIIEDTLEPTILADGNVVAMGKVILRQGE